MRGRNPWRRLYLRIRHIRVEGNKTWIDVVGLDERKRLYVQWTRTKLRTGDEILIKVIDRKSVDKFKTIRRLNENEGIASMERHTRNMARALGWEVIVKKKRR